MRALLAACLGLHASLAAAAGSSDSLVGTWRLVSYTDTPENGAPVHAFGAYQTHWEKTSLGSTIIGDWAFERYTYKSKDVEKKTRAVTTDTGKGINIFRRGADGKWRVAVDGWSSDHAAR